MEHCKQEMQDKIAARHNPGAAPGAKPHAYAAIADVPPPSSDASGVHPAVEAANAAYFDPAPSLLTNPVDAEWLASASAHGDCSYEAYVALAGPLSACLDWDSALTASSPSPKPFLFDSGATTHISPLRSDFVSIMPIPPCGIRGVNGSVVYAAGTGRIKLSVGRGKSITLENALYVPSATVRLISVRALCDGPHAFRVSFSTTDVTIFDRSGALFFSGARVGRGLYALSGSAPVVASAFLAAPTLETWHHRLSHANYKSTMDVIARICAAGTPVNSSSPPPKCDSCILGKQTRTPVPKLREGVRSTERGTRRDVLCRRRW